MARHVDDGLGDPSALGATGLAEGAEGFGLGVTGVDESGLAPLGRAVPPGALQAASSAISASAAIVRLTILRPSFRRAEG